MTTSADIGERPSRARSRGRPESIAISSAWNAANQLIMVVLSIVVLPVMLRRLGISAYGVYALGLTTMALLQQIDGGLLSSVGRYLAVYRGAGDRTRLSQLVFSSSLLIIIGGTAIALALSLGSGALLHFTHIPPSLRPGARLYFSVIAFLLPLGLLQALESSVLQAHARFRALSIAGITMTAGRFACIVLFVHGPDALQTTAWVWLGYQLAYCITLMPYALSYVRFRGVGLVPRADMYKIIRYAFSVQISQASTLVNMQVGAIVVAVIVPIRDVSLYSTGANLANQVRSLLGNVLYPAGVRLAAIYGAEGDEATFVAYRKLQNNWVKMTTGVFFVAIGASVFVMESWLGQKFQLAGIVCVILLAGYMVNMLTGMLTLYLNAIGRPGVEARYGVVSMVVNLVLTVPLAFIGLLGVAAAAAIGTTVGSAYLLATARRRVRQEIPSYLRSAPWLRGIVAAGVAAAGCVAMRTLINVQGPLGLIVCGVAASPALALYAVLVLGPRRAIGDGGAGIRRLLRPPRHAALSGRRSSVRNSTGSVRPRRRPGRHFLPNGSEPLKP